LQAAAAQCGDNTRSALGSDGAKMQ
jgi:hypothetical protein